MSIWIYPENHSSFEDKANQEEIIKKENIDIVLNESSESPLDFNPSNLTQYGYYISVWIYGIFAMIFYSDSPEISQVDEKYCYNNDLEMWLDTSREKRRLVQIITVLILVVIFLQLIFLFSQELDLIHTSSLVISIILLLLLIILSFLVISTNNTNQNQIIAEKAQKFEQDGNKILIRIGNNHLQYVKTNLEDLDVNYTVCNRG